MRTTKSAWRVGGGVSAGGSRRVSSMLRVRVPAVIDSLAVRFQVAIFLPTLGQTEQFFLWHRDQRQRLPAFGNQRVIVQSSNAKCAPEARALHMIQPALDDESIA